MANDIADYYGEKSQDQEVEQFCKVHNQVAAPLFEELVSCPCFVVLTEVCTILVFNVLS